MKLLQKTIRHYFIYSFIVLLISIPVFYYLLLDIVKEDIDEDLYASRELIIPKLKTAIANNTLSQIQFLDHDLAVAKSANPRIFDTLYTVEIFDSVSGEIVPHRVLATNMQVGSEFYLMHIRTSLLDYDNLIQAILTVEIILLLLLLIGLILINRNLTKKIWRPFYQTLDTLKNYRVENHNKLSLSTSNVKEFNDLNSTLEQLSERNYSAFTSQKEFAENASHEMQTPLAILQGKLELLMQTSPLNEDQAKLIDEIADAGQRLVRLNKSLVLLTKIDNNQFAEKEQISLREIVEKFIQQYRPQAEQKKLNIQFYLTQDEVLPVNRALIEILVSNLIGNSIRHNNEKGSIMISISKGKLVIQNTGKEKTLDDNKLFQRFHKESADSNSIGLGLEIIKKICTIYHYTISYQFNSGFHNFTLDFNNKS